MHAKKQIHATQQKCKGSKRRQAEDPQTQLHPLDKPASARRKPTSPENARAHPRVSEDGGRGGRVRAAEGKCEAAAGDGGGEERERRREGRRRAATLRRERHDARRQRQ
eukprot:1660368-Pleurochrysis_carterae.AAC.1